MLLNTIIYWSYQTKERLFQQNPWVLYIELSWEFYCLCYKFNFSFEKGSLCYSFLQKIHNLALKYKKVHIKQKDGPWQGLLLLLTDLNYYVKFWNVVECKYKVA